MEKKKLTSSSLLSTKPGLLLSLLLRPGSSCLLDQLLSVVLLRNGRGLIVPSLQGRLVHDTVEDTGDEGGVPDDLEVGSREGIG